MVAAARLTSRPPTAGITDPVTEAVPDDAPSTAELVRHTMGRTRLTHDERRDVTRHLLETAARTTDPAARELALDAVIRLNRRIAVAVARRYVGRGVEQEDLEQAACEGLVKAVHRFDPSREHDLLSYAVPSIRGEVLRFFRDYSWSVRPPRRVQELQLRLRRVSAAMTVAAGREPTPAEVQEATGTSPEDYAEAGSALGCFTPASLDLPPEVGAPVTLGDSLAADVDEHGAVEARTMLAGVLGRLDEREATVIYLRYFEERSQREIGLEYGVTQATVSRWLGEIMLKLRQGLEPAAPEDVDGP